MRERAINDAVLAVYLNTDPDMDLKGVRFPKYRFARAVRVDDSVRAALGELVDLAPLHQPKSLAALANCATSASAFDAVQHGSCQALILDVPIIEAQNQKQPGAFAGVVGQIDTHEGYGAVFASTTSRSSVTVNPARR